MGTWGTETFEDDQALDWLYDLEEIDDISFIEESLDITGLNDGIDEISGTDFIAACEIVAALLNRPSEFLPENAIAWVKKNKKINVNHLIDNCIIGLTAITGDGSGLKELWEETDHYKKWLENINDLKRRIINR